MVEKHEWCVVAGSIVVLCLMDFDVYGVGVVSVNPLKNENL